VIRSSRSLGCDAQWQWAISSRWVGALKTWESSRVDPPHFESFPDVESAGGSCGALLSIARVMPWRFPIKA